MPIPLHWHTEPLLLTSIIGVTWLYAVCCGPLRRSIAPDAPFSRISAIQYFAGIAIVYVAVGSPIDQLGEEYLFFVHMIQHILLIYCAPPLILRGIPPWLVDKVLDVRWVRFPVRWLVHPVAAILLFNLTYTVWHIPALYEAALQDKRIHIFEHWTMFSTAVLLWWPLVSRSRILPPLSIPARLVYVFFLMVAQTPVFAFLTLSGEVLYPTYEFAPRIIPGFPALHDQVAGGIIMKVSTMFTGMLLVAIYWMKWWKNDSENADAMVRNFRQSRDKSSH